MSALSLNKPHKNNIILDDDEGQGDDAQGFHSQKSSQGAHIDIPSEYSQKESFPKSEYIELDRLQAQNRIEVLLEPYVQKYIQKYSDIALGRLLKMLLKHN